MQRTQRARASPCPQGADKREGLLTSDHGTGRHGISLPRRRHKGLRSSWWLADRFLTGRSREEGRPGGDSTPVVPAVLETEARGLCYRETIAVTPYSTHAHAQKVSVLNLKK